MKDLIFIIDIEKSGIRPLDDLILQVAESGATMIEIRDKVSETRPFIENVLKIKKLLKSFNIPLLISGRVDVALAGGANGVHLEAEDIPFKMARKILGKNDIIGISAENYEQIKKAENLNIDYISLSPAFESQSSAHKTPWGIEGIKNARMLTRHNIIATGGLRKDENIRAAIEAGANGIAVSSYICNAQNVRAATNHLKNIIMPEETIYG